MARLMTALITLNTSVEQIESDLRHGRTVDEIVSDWQEPKTNVIAVLRAMQARGERMAAAPSKQPAAPVAGARALTSVPHPPTTPAADAGQSGLAVDALVNAAARSRSKRTQALGVKLADLAAAVRTRLAEEREQAERAEKERADREAAAAEVERLETQLREARAKMRGRRAGGGSTPMPRDPKPRTASQLANLAGGRAHGEFPCRNDGCSRILTTAAARGSHERNCGGAS